MIVRLNKKDKAIIKVFRLPGDKSIAHRAILIGSLGVGKYEISNFPNNEDCRNSISCMEALGVKIRTEGTSVFVNTPGYENFNKLPKQLYCGNSGTTARLISGILAGCGIEAVIDGDNSLRKRPMNRIIIPLRQMGAALDSGNGLLPLEFHSCDKLDGIEYVMPVASAQVKSCVLIAGFLSKGETIVVERQNTRDHTERMFKDLGANLQIKGDKLCIKNGSIKVKNIDIPGDISSAAFLIGYALLHKSCSIKIENVLLNERRISFLALLKKMGADIKYKVTRRSNCEDTGYIIVKESKLKGVTVNEQEIPNIIDEIPMLAVLSCFAEGKTVFKGITELKHKESDRIKSIAYNLTQCGVDSIYSEDFLEIQGDKAFFNKDIFIKPFMDHRIALAFAAVSCRNLKNTVIENWECTSVSFPNSLNYLKEFFYIETEL